MTTPTGTRTGPGRTELGTISLDDRVVEKLAGQIVVETPDAGAAATRILGVTVPGAGLLGTRETDLQARPKVSATIDGSVASLDISMSVRWPASIRTVTEAVREAVTRRVGELTDLDVTEVRIVVTDLATDLPAPRRVR